MASLKNKTKKILFLFNKHPLPSDLFQVIKEIFFWFLDSISTKILFSGVWFALDSHVAAILRKPGLPVLVDEGGTKTQMFHVRDWACWSGNFR